MRFYLSRHYRETKGAGKPSRGERPGIRKPALIGGTVLLVEDEAQVRAAAVEPYATWAT